MPRKKTAVTEEDLDGCYFCLNFDLIDAKNPRIVEIPRDFYCDDFMALNPLDIQELLSFQKKYGWIMGARSEMPLMETRKALRPTPSGSVFAGGRAEGFSDQVAGIRASAALFDTVPDEEMVDKHELLKISAVTFREAIATVLDAQRTIRETARVLRDDLPPMTKREAGTALFATEYLAANLAHVAPTIRLSVDGTPPPHNLWD